MLTKPEGTRGTWTGLGILALGIAIGALARPSRWFERTDPVSPREPFPALVPADPPELAPANELTTIELVIPDASAAVLERVRARAMEQGVITQTDADTVPAEFVSEGVRQPCRLRIKGDWTDHVEGQRWSYRIRLDKGSFLGMREFSIQAPFTRGYLWEWLVQEAARRERVLVPRSTFLNVIQNGHALGVYFLEEHFAKELLESQGRREGPIVVWDESTLWSTLLQEGSTSTKGVAAFSSALPARAHDPDPAEVRAFGEQRLSSLDGLNSALHAALDEMKRLRTLALDDQPGTDPRRALQAMDQLRAATLEGLVDVERLGCAHALLSLFQSEHALAWHNMRFYRDPVQARLEPVLFDAAAQEPSARDPVPWRATGLAAAFARSPAYEEALFLHLGRMLRSDWLDGFLTQVEPELRRFEAALRSELPPGYAADEMKQRLREQILFLRKACLPADAVNFDCEYEVTDAARNAGKGWLEVRAWATTRSPVVLEGFQFSNGSVSAAASSLVPSPGARVRGLGVILPSDGRIVSFRFPMDERLANLETVAKFTKAVRQAIREDETLDLDVRALSRLLVSEESQVELLSFRRHAPGADQGRPAAPSVEEVLERHGFLRFDFARRELAALVGEWDVSGDLVLPSGIPLKLQAGTTLRFQQDALLLADAPLDFEGTSQAPIVLEPAAGAANWAGVIVLGAAGRSTWTEVTVRKTTAAVRGGWIQTGAVTFYRSPVSMLRCRFEGTEAEDGLNIFSADVLLDGIELSGCRSDSFDGDFVTGEIRNSVFRDGQADGVDVSGSTVRIVDCRFERLGDKALSIGERSQAYIQGGHALDVAIGVACKDASLVELEGMRIEARNYALAAFVKKPVYRTYGPTRLRARGVEIRADAEHRAIVQTGCELEIDGLAVPTQDIDVDASYQAGVLGRGK